MYVHTHFVVCIYMASAAPLRSWLFGVQLIVGYCLLHMDALQCVQGTRKALRSLQMLQEVSRIQRTQMELGDIFAALFAACMVSRVWLNVSAHHTVCIGYIG